jgi:N-methylhydantoinase B
MSTTGVLDPMTVAVIRNGILSAAREIFWAFKRTSMLPALYEYQDFGISLFDDRMNMIADAPGVATFIGSLDGCLRRTVAELGGPEQLAAGDILLNNHPFLTGGHPADAALMQPIFHEGALVGFATLRAHIGDLGAKGFYPVDSTDMFQEGTIIPATKLFSGGELDTTVIRVMEANSRLPRETVGDVFAGVGALQAGARKIASVIERHGVDAYYATIDALLDHGERVARRAIAAIPDGTYVREDFMDDNGVDREPVKLRCAITIDGSDVTIDLTGSADEQLGPVNCPLVYTTATCRFALKMLTTPELPASSGEDRPLTVIAPEGSIFNPRAPAATHIGWVPAIRLGDSIPQALATALPDVVPAEHAGDVITTIALLRDPDTRRWCFFGEPGAIGHGARRDRDGMHTLIHQQQAGCAVIPAELLETRLPIVKRRFELQPDSGGPGRFRGGLSAVAEFEALSDGVAIVIAEKTAASEVRGHESGMSPPFKNSVVLFPDTERELRLGKRSDVPIAPGDVVVITPAGGAGYGDPLEREPELVAADVRDEYVSGEQAERVYGVALDARTGEVDGERTAALRARLRQA